VRNLEIKRSEGIIAISNKKERKKELVFWFFPLKLEDRPRCTLWNLFLETKKIGPQTDMRRQIKRQTDAAAAAAEEEEEEESPIAMMLMMMMTTMRWK
jgi:hypothetical protein